MPGDTYSCRGVMKAKSNIVLIGMPGSGKSTIGVILAKRTSHDFVDTDVLIQSLEHRSLQSIMDSEGYMRLNRKRALPDCRPNGGINPRDAGKCRSFWKARRGSGGQGGI